MLDKLRKLKLSNRLLEAKKHKAISNSLYQFVTYILEGDTDFDLVYLSGRGQYVGVVLKQELGKGTAKILLMNQYKRECLKLKNFRRI